MELKKAKDIRAGEWIRWFGKPRNVMNVTKVNLSGISISFTIGNLPITLDFPDVATVIIEVAKCSTSSCSFKENDKIEVVRDIFDDGSRAGSPNDE